MLPCPEWLTVILEKLEFAVGELTEATVVIELLNPPALSRLSRRIGRIQEARGGVGVSDFKRRAE